MAISNEEWNAQYEKLVNYMNQKMVDVIAKEVKIAKDAGYDESFLQSDEFKVKLNQKVIEAFSISGLQHDDEEHKSSELQSWFEEQREKVK